MIAWLKTVFIVFAGVVQPIGAIAYELATGQCAAVFFDPLPTLVHVALVSLVPLINLRTWWALRVDHAPNLRSLLLWNGFALGIALFYTVLFLPLVPIGVVGIIVGLGLLPLAPLAALTAAMVLRRALKRRAPGPAHYRVWPAAGTALLALSLLQLPGMLTQIGLQMAVAPDPVERLRGVRLLRLAGSEEAMLRACYVRGGQLVDVFSVLLATRRHVSPEAARGVYYRVTGVAFNTRAVPTGLDLHRFDGDLGGTVVGQRHDGLRLTDSALVGKVDSKAAQAYFEWTLALENNSDRIAEGRFRLLLPRDAVVSRVSLWIDGEPREAAFGTSSAVRSAYDKVVARQRDPLLVTASGPGEVLVQLFPIPARGGVMKFRLGVTAPLQLESLTAGRVALPAIQEHNFSMASANRHAISVTADQAIGSDAADLNARAATGGGFALTGALAGTGDVTITASRAPLTSISYSETGDDGAGSTVTQAIVADPRRFRHVVLVVDGSKSMASHREAILEALAGAPRDMRWTVLVAGDEVHEFELDDATHLRGLSHDLAAIAFVGGIDNSASLARAATLARSEVDTAVLWLHGPQWLEPAAAAAIDAYAGADATPLYALQLVPGPNAILAPLSRSRSVHRLRGEGDLPQTLARLVAGWQGRVPVYRYARSLVHSAPDEATAANPSSRTHTARLWAWESVRDLIADAAAPTDAQAVALAMQYQLVTPVTGAVVLETAADYAQAGLEAVSAGTVPTVPEPAVVVLLLVALLSLAGMRCRFATLAR